MSENRKAFLSSIGLCAFSGGLTSLAFSVECLWFLCFFSIMPMFAAFEKHMKKLRFRQCVISFFFFGFSLYSTLMLWLLELSPVLEEAIPKSASCALIMLAVILAGIIIGVYYAVPLMFTRVFSKGVFFDCVIFSFVFIFGEFVTQLFTPLSFPWARLCAIVTPFTEFIQSANLFGGLFISFIIALTNCLLCSAVLNFKNKKICAISLLSALLIFGMNTAYGFVRLHNAKPLSEEKNAVIVQGNFSGLSKWRHTREEIIETYISLAQSEVDENTGFVVFPETAAPFRLYQDENSLKMLTDFANTNDIVLVTGVFTEEDGLVYNSLVCIEPNGDISEPYNKQVLVPLGEYVPFADILMEHFPQLFDIIGYVEPGDDNGMVQTLHAKIGGVICYESVYPEIVRKTVSDGAEIITIISNDSWFGESPALYQHHAHAILRAVENNRYVLRASSTAISSAIDNYGNVLETAPKLEQAAIKSSYSVIPEKSLYTIVGDIILIPSALILIYAIYKLIKLKKNADS